MDTKEKKRRPAQSGASAPKTQRKRPPEQKAKTAPEAQRKRNPEQKTKAAPENQRKRNPEQKAKAAPENQRKRNPEQKAQTKQTAQTQRKPAPERKRERPAAPRQTDPDRRRRTGAPNTPDREERQRRVRNSRQAKAKNPPATQRVIRPPREEVPQVVYRAPRPMRRGTFTWKLVSMAAVVAAVFLGLSVFFRVDTIAVAGADKYTPWMIREASGIAIGDALLSVGEARVASRIQMELPYVDQVKVGVRLPGTVEIQVTELQVTYSIEDENGAWWLISSTGRAVEQVSLEKALGYTRAEGLAIRAPQPGQQIQAVPGQRIDPGDGTAVTLDQSQADEQLNALIAVMTALEKGRIIGEVARIDVTNPADLRLEYPQLLTVLLGNTERMDYKIGYLAAAVQTLSDSQSGVLDLTLQYAEDAIFSSSR